MKHLYQLKDGGNWAWEDLPMRKSKFCVDCVLEFQVCTIAWILFNVLLLVFLICRYVRKTKYQEVSKFETSQLGSSCGPIGLN